MLKGLKDDGFGTKNQKLRYDLIPPEILKGLAEIYTYGAESKYGENTWQEVDKKRYIAAAFRHFEAFRSGEILDDESGFQHLFHAMWNIGTIAYLTEKDKAIYHQLKLE